MTAATTTPDESDHLDALDKALSHPLYAKLFGPELADEGLTQAAAIHKRLGLGTRAHLQQRIDYLHACAALEGATDLAELRETVDELGDLIDRGLQAVVHELRGQRQASRRTNELLQSLLQAWGADEPQADQVEPTGIEDVDATEVSDAD